MSSRLFGLRNARTALLAAAIVATLVLILPIVPSAPLLADSVTVVSDISPNRSNKDSSDPDAATGGRVNGTATVSGDSSTLYAASEWGGLYKSTDSGRTWSHLGSHVPQATWDVEVDPSEPNRVYATSFFDGRTSSVSGINVSTDGGTTWTHPPSSVPVFGSCEQTEASNEPSAFGISIDPVDSSNVFIATNCGLAVSNDSGQTWRYENPLSSSSAPKLWDVVAHGNGVVDVCGDEGHFHSENGGNTWTAGTGLPSGRCSMAASPDESYVLITVVGVRIYETTDAGAPGGAVWQETRWNPRAQGRIPFVATNQRSNVDSTDLFDLWFGDVSVYRVACETPTPPAPGGAPRCGTGNSPPWSPGYTRSYGGHDDMGDIAFDSTVSTDACPVLMSSDGGVYFNLRSTSPGCHEPSWEQPDVTPHGLWLFAMSGARIPGAVDENLYMGNQDNGVFGTLDAGGIAPTWHNQICCDGFDSASDAERIVYSVCCYGGSRPLRFFIANPDHTGVSELNTYPPQGKPAGWKFTESIAQFASKSYAMITRDCSAGSSGCPGPDGGTFITTDITANPIVWTELGDATEPPGDVCGVTVSLDAANTPTFFVQSGSCNNSGTSDRLFKFVGTDPSGAWEELVAPGGGFGVVGIHPNDPQKIMTSVLEPDDAKIYESTDGGSSWARMLDLEDKMTGGGDFAMKNDLGPTLWTGFAGYWQPNLLAYDPVKEHLRIAGAVDAGIFLSSDRGQHWKLVTDPYDPGSSGIPHISRPWYAYFDDEDPHHVFVGTQGKGIWRLAIENAPPVAVCQSALPAADASCNATVAAGDIDGGSHDPDGEFEIETMCITEVNGSPVGCVPSVELSGLGDSLLKLQVTDYAGESDTCEALVTVVDVTPPSIDTLNGPGENSCHFTDPPASATASDNCDPNPSVSVVRNDETDTDSDPACDARSYIGEATDASGNTGSGCAGAASCPVPYSVNPNDCDADAIPDCFDCDFAYDMACLGANVSKILFGTGAGDGKITINGSMGLGDCPASTDPFGNLLPTDRVTVRLDGTIVFDQPWSAFSQGKGNVWKYRGSGGSMLLHFDSAKWKFSHRGSDIVSGDVDNGDGVRHTLRVGRHEGEESIGMTGDSSQLKFARHGKSAVSCK